MKLPFPFILSLSASFQFVLLVQSVILHGHFNAILNQIDACDYLHLECDVKSIHTLYFFWSPVVIPKLTMETCLPWPTKFDLEHHISDQRDWLFVTPQLMDQVRNQFGNIKSAVMTHVTVPALKMGFQTLWFDFSNGIYLKTEQSEKVIRQNNIKGKIPTIIQCQSASMSTMTNINDHGIKCKWAK